MDLGATQTDKPKNKKADDNAQGLTTDGIDRPYVSRKGGCGIASIEDCVDTSIQGLDGYNKKNKESGQ